MYNQYSYDSDLYDDLPCDHESSTLMEDMEIEKRYKRIRYLLFLFKVSRSVHTARHTYQFC